MALYLVTAMIVDQHYTGKYGPFGTSDKAEDCVLRLAERPEVMSAEIKKKKEKK